MTRIACILPVVLPAVALLYYIHTFGVNVIFWDEWEMIPLVQKIMSGSLSFSDLFAQHNEHRILFPRIAMLAIGVLTRYDTTAEMYFSWLLICMTGLIIFYVYKKSSSCTSNSRLALLFVPVSLLLFSFRQYESILWGFTCQVYLTIFGVVVTFALLEVSKKIDTWFIVCLLSAFLASFSFSVGLVVWPVALVQILMSEGRRAWRKAASWCLFGTIVLVSYFYGYVKPGHHPPLNYVLTAPLAASGYFLAFIGAPFSYDAATSGASGLVMTLIGLWVMIYAVKGRLLAKNRVWFSLILFAVLSSLVTTVGRSGFGIGQALASRYVFATTIGIIGVYFLALSVSGNSRAKNGSFGVHALIALFLLGLIVSNGLGWQAGQNTKSSREMGAYVLETYGIQSDENICNFLYPAAGVVRERAKFLEQHKLNVFANEVVDPSTLVLIRSDTIFALDTINGKIVSVRDSPIVIHTREEKTITIIGWAADRQAKDVASAVFLNIDGEIDIPAMYGLDRPDVANAFNTPSFRFSGYMVMFSSSILGEGQHSISLKIVSRDGLHFYYVQQVLYLYVMTD